jgi:hypothetical protein
MISVGIELYCFLTFPITPYLEPYWVMQESEFFLDWQIIAVTSDTILPTEWHSTAGSIRTRLGVSTVHGQLDMWDDSVLLQSATSLAPSQSYCLSLQYCGGKQVLLWYQVLKMTIQMTGNWSHDKGIF